MGEPQAVLDQVVLSRVVNTLASTDPGRLCYIFENGGHGAEEVTAGALARNGNQIAAALRRAGLGPDARVAVMLRNHPEFVHTLVANAKLGLPTVPIDPRARGPKLAYFLEFAECSALITADYVLADPAAAEPIRRAGIPVWVLSTPEGRAHGLGSPEAPFESLDAVLAAPDEPEVGEHLTDVTRPWLLAFTSGTTGDPKAIEFAWDRLLFYRRVPAIMGYRPDDVPYTGLSLTHGNALVVTMLPPLYGACSHAVFSRWFTSGRIWDVCREHGVTTWSNLGGIATAVYSRAPRAADRDHSVRLVVSAGMPAQLWTAFEERFGVRVLEWYGTMEGGFAHNPVGVGPVGSFGKPPEGLIEMDVVDDDGVPVSPDVPGELVVRPAGGRAQLSYFKNPQASAAKLRDGWLRTGDVVTRDGAGWYFFRHRREERGLRKMGEFIAEGFLRRVLAEAPEVVDVAVYGVPSRMGGVGETDIVAALVVRDPAVFDPAALFDRCAAQLEGSHVPDLIQVVDDLPRTASQKVQTRLLAAALEEPGARVHRRSAGLTRGRG